MSSINKVILIGRLGADPDIRYTANGDQMTNISLATSERWRDRASGEMKEATEWHRVSFFGKTAEIAGQYLKKGSQVYVEGSIRTNKYTDRDGIERYATNINGTSMQMLGSRPSADSQMDDRDFSRPAGDAPHSSSGFSQPPPSRSPSRPPNFSDMDDDIPF